MALPPTYYQGTDGAWLAANFSLGAVPVDDNHVIAPAAVTASITGIDQTLIDLEYLEFARGYRGNIGASGNPLIIDADKLIHRGSGTLWHESTATALGGADWIVIDSDNVSSLAANIAGAVTHRVSVRKGQVTLAATLGSTTLPNQVDVSYRNNPSDDATVTINCALLANTGILNMMAGLCTITVGGAAAAAFPIVNITGGTLTFTNNGGATDVITTAYIGGTGVLRYNTINAMVTAYILKGGTLDLLQNDVAKTIGTVHLFPGGRLIYDPDVTTITTLNDLGGIIQKVKDAAGGFGGAPQSS